jgi:hypothetical protein
MSRRGRTISKKDAEKMLQIFPHGGIFAEDRGHDLREDRANFSVNP